MRNPLALLRPRNAANDVDQAHLPVPYVSRTGGMGGGLGASGGSELGAMAATGTGFAVVDLLANSCAQVEWRLYKVGKSGMEGDREEVPDHPALTLWRKPNPFMVRALFMESVNQHYELTGGGAMVIYKVGALPVQLWPCRPDRLEPVPDQTKFLTGWIYKTPDGEKVPLGIDEVLWIRTPNPMDPYRGLGPFGSLGPVQDTARYADLYNRNFFINSAEPGGIIKAPTMLSDEDFARVKQRWNESHRGVAAAHRVAILEGMEWVDRSTTHKDMQFVELRHQARDTIMEAKRVGKHMLGITEDVNRANAEAAEVVHARWQLIPRLERWKQLLNYQLLPMFGDVTGRGFEFDYDNPVPEDADQERADLTARVDAWVKLVDQGADPMGAASAVGLPEIPMATEGASPRQIAEMVQKIYLGVGTVITWEEARQVLADGGMELDLNAPPPDAPAPRTFARAERLPLPRSEQAGKPDVDLDEVQSAWESALAALMAEWGGVTTAWQADLVDQVRSAIDAGNYDQLTRLSVPSAEAARLLGEHMAGLAEVAAEKVVAEARGQGVHDMEAATPTDRVIDDQAAVTAGLLAADLAIRAGREAMRVQSPDLTGNQVADLVGQFLAGMSDASTKSSLGGALTGAQNQARIETFKTGPVASLYADEKLDSNTCKPCRAIDGHYIGSTADGVSMAEVERLYPMGGYVDCLGRDRCRGTITGVWRPQAVTDE